MMKEPTVSSPLNNKATKNTLKENRPQKHYLENKAPQDKYH